MRIALISDTHDLLRPEAIAHLEGADEIIHTGDFCGPDILEALENIAPVRAVRGNCDHGEWATNLRLNDTWEIDGVLIHAVHDLKTIDLDPAAAGVSLVLFGHTHQPHRSEEKGVTYFNAGSAGPRRFNLPISMASLVLEDGHMELAHIDLENPRP